MAASENPRRRLRDVTVGDLDAYLRMRSDPTMMTHLGGPIAAERVEESLRREIAETEAGRARISMVDVRVGDEWRTAGTITLVPDDAPGSAEVGWMILPEHQGKGIATWAVAETLKRAVADGPWSEIHAYPSRGNGASNAICLNLGFRNVGRRTIEFNGQRFDTNNWVVRVPGRLPVFAPWIHGTSPTDAPTDPPLQVQRFTDSTIVVRQSMDVDFEAPFLYLFFGDSRAFLFDTGATADPALFPLRATVDALITEWLDAHPCDGYELVVAHSHQHGDHIAGDGQFAERRNTVIVGTDVDAVRAFYGFGEDLGEVASIDLGGRTLDILRIPGHDETSIAVFDSATGWLLTGDTVYPGRLYVRDGEAFVASLKRLGEFGRSRPVTAVMGCHIEMTTTPGVDYPAGTPWQPDEPPLPMSVAQLGAIVAVAQVARQPGRHVFDDVIIEA